MYLGIVRMDGRHDQTGAAEAFAAARNADPAVQLDRTYASDASIALFAQTAPSPAADQPPATPPPPIPAPAPAPPPAGPVEPAPPEESPAPVACSPDCPPGTTCVTGQCVSACIPPCAPSDTCGSDGVCRPAAPAPTAPGPPAAPLPAVAPAPAAHPPPPPPPADSGRLHQGRYLRVGLGGGVVLGGAEFPFDNNGTSGTFSGTMWGGAWQLELAVGGTPAPGFVLGGGFWLANSLGDANMYIEQNTSISSWGTKGAGSVSTWLLGPMVDWYVVPTGGFHTQLGLGVGRVTIGQGGTAIQECLTSGGVRTETCTSPDIPPGSMSWIGLGAMLGVGYEFWVGREWSLGVMARATYIGGEKMAPWTPGVLLTLTYN
jgi:hypothetical protein